MKKEIIVSFTVIIALLSVMTLSIANEQNSNAKVISVRRGAYMKSIIPGLPSCAEFRSDHMGLVQVCPVTSKPISSAVFMVEKYYDNPVGTVSLNGTYEYFVVAARRIKQQDFDKLILRYRVPNSWLQGNGLNRTSLYRWEVDNWRELNTTIVVENADYTYFESEIKSFSVLAVSKPRSEMFNQTTTTTSTTTTTVAANQTTTTVSGNQTTTTVTNNETDYSFLFQGSIAWVPAIIVIIVLLAIIMSLRRSGGGELQ